MKSTVTKKESKKFKRDPSVKDIDIRTLMEDTPAYTPNGARTPDIMYRTNDLLRDNGVLIEPHGDVPMESSLCKKSLNFNFLVNGFTLKCEEDLDIKLASFKKQLKSKSEEDTAANARILLDILKSYSMTFNMEVEDVLDTVTHNNRGGLSLKKIRGAMLKHFECM